jgi:hypothetical protein
MKLREQLPTVSAIQSLTTGNIIKRSSNQVFYKTAKCYELWDTEPLRLVIRFKRKNIGFVFED